MTNLKVYEYQLILHQVVQHYEKPRTSTNPKCKRMTTTHSTYDDKKTLAT
jgi:hypothetical protein